MNKKGTIKEMFDYKINKNKIKDNVLNKVNDKDYKFVYYLKLSVVFVFVLLGFIAFSEMLKGENDIEDEKIYDISKPEIAIGTSQYVFFAKVNKIDKEENLKSTENDALYDGEYIQHTVYYVKVLYNIKGNLVTNNDIEIWQYDKYFDGNNNIEANNLLEENEYYILMTSVIDGELQIDDKNKIVKLDNLDLLNECATCSSIFPSVDNIHDGKIENNKITLEEILKQYEYYYKKQIIPEGFVVKNELSKYDVNYKKEND